MSLKVAVITGASRGIGAALTEKAIKSGFKVYAVARSVESSAQLNQLGKEFPGRLLTVKCDLSDLDSIEEVRKQVAAENQVDLLINNAGVLLNGDSAEEMMQSYKVNTVAPFLLTKALLPQLEKSDKPQVVHLTSLMGSISDNSSGGYYAYRCSKTALNMVNMSLCRDYRWLTTIVVHPGWVKTDMGGPGAKVSVTDSVNGIWKIIENLSPDLSGRFLDFQGQSIAW